MTLTSMTGFGSAQARSGRWQIRVECRSVNHRSLETRVYVPAQCRWIEPVVLERVRDYAQRGRLDVRIELSDAPDSPDAPIELVDEARFARVCHQLDALARTNGLATPLSMRDVLSFSRHFELTGDEATLEDDATLVETIDEALGALAQSRMQEGEGIAADFHRHLDAIEGFVARIEAILPGEQDAFRGRLEERLREVLERHAIEGLEEARLVQELVFYADRSDIAEELQRAGSHLGKLRSLLDPPPEGTREPRGKKIDFYLQELFRETNTMGSKSNSAALTDLVIEIKSRIEKMREQAANVE